MVRIDFSRPTLHVSLRTLSKILMEKRAAIWGAYKKGLVASMDHLDAASVPILPMGTFGRVLRW